MSAQLRIHAIVGVVGEAIAQTRSVAAQMRERGGQCDPADVAALLESMASSIENLVGPVTGPQAFKCLRCQSPIDLKFCHEYCEQKYTEEHGAAP